MRPYLKITTERKKKEKEVGWWCGVAEATEDTYHDRSTFEQGDFEAEDLHVDSFDIGDFQVAITNLVGDTHYKVVVLSIGPARLRQYVSAGAHKMMQSSIKCQVVGVTRGNAGGCA